MIAAGEVQLVVNTPSGSGARADGALIRGACVVHAVVVSHDDQRRLRRRQGDRRHPRPGMAGRLAPGAAPMSDLADHASAR